MAAATRLIEEHQKLTQTWLEAERERVNILQKVLQEYGDKCVMDYPENLFKSYEEALIMAASANHEYVQWLAAHGIQSR